MQIDGGRDREDEREASEDRKWVGRHRRTGSGLRRTGVGKEVGWEV